ncbi:MAG: hypothetical protein RL748_2139 [Pseudomonadota bacterium]|jgi:hypothetical protein
MQSGRHKIYENVSVDELQVKRAGYGFSVSFTVISADEKITLTMCGVRDISLICELLEADRLWVEETEDVQTEFGRLTLGFYNQAYYEVIFDTLTTE